MSQQPRTRLFERESQEVVEADLVESVSKDQLIETHLDWLPARYEALKRLREEGKQWPEHWHWDWSQKAQKLNFLAYRCFGIQCQDRMQGLMMVSMVARRSRSATQTGKPVLYIEYIESAPWNLKELTDAPKFSGVGVAFLEAAANLSIEEGFGGRVGLHSLPQSEPFYRRYMEDRGIDREHKEELRYFEMTVEQAHTFLGDRAK